MILTVIAGGCKKDTEDLFDKPADERISDALTSYQTALTQAPGWKLFVYPSGLQSQGVEVGGLTYYVRFSNENRALMVSDFNTDMATFRESVTAKICTATVANF